MKAEPFTLNPQLMRLATNQLPVGSLLIFHCAHNAKNEWLLVITDNRHVPYEFEPIGDHCEWDHAYRFERLRGQGSMDDIVARFEGRTSRKITRTKCYFDALAVWEVVS